MPFKTPFEGRGDLYDVVTQIVRDELASLLIASPGTVEDYDPVASTIDVVPTVKQAFLGDDGGDRFEDRPIIKKVPYMHIRGQAPEKDDQVWLMWSHESLAKWKTDDGLERETVRPRGRGNAYIECVAIGIFDDDFTS